MNICNADIICFDADYTLVKYTNREFIYLQYISLAKCMIKLGAPQDLLTMVNKDEINIIGGPGLVADFKTGCLLKLNEDFTILHAFHGLTPCDNLTELYGNPPTYKVTQIDKYLIRSDRLLFLTHFKIGGSALWMTCVELMKNSRYQLSSYVELSEKFLQAIRLNYLDFSTSEFYDYVFQDPGLYIVKASEDFKQLLYSLKAANKKLGIVSNHVHEFINFAMEYSYGPDWHSLFDIYIYSAGKPEFFKQESDLQLIESLQLEHPAYNKGSSKDLRSKLGCQNCLFIGDDYLSDIFAAKQDNWQTVAIIEEIYYEKGISTISSQDKIEESVLNRPEDDIILYFNNWGSFFINQGKKTMWWDFVTKYADVMIPKLECLIDLFKNHRIT